MDARSVDLARLIAIVAEEVMAATPAAASPCACHAVRGGLLSDAPAGRHRRRRDAARDSRRGRRAGGVASLIDHTLLKPDATRQDIETALPRGRRASASRPSA